MKRRTSLSRCHQTMAKALAVTLSVLLLGRCLLSSPLPTELRGIFFALPEHAALQRRIEPFIVLEGLYRGGEALALGRVERPDQDLVCRDGEPSLAIDPIRHVRVHIALLSGQTVAYQRIVLRLDEVDIVDPGILDDLPIDTARSQLEWAWTQRDNEAGPELGLQLRDNGRHRCAVRRVLQVKVNTLEAKLLDDRSGRRHELRGIRRVVDDRRVAAAADHADNLASAGLPRGDLRRHRGRAAILARIGRDAAPSVAVDEGSDQREIINLRRLGLDGGDRGRVPRPPPFADNVLRQATRRRTARARAAAITASGGVATTTDPIKG